MAQLNESYYVPSDIRWVDASKDVSSSSISTSERAVVEEGGAAKKLCWVCSHSNFQYQYRTRQRLSPGPAATASREWTDWGEWLGNDLTSETRSAAERMEHISNTTITTAADEFPLPYAFADYDKIEYQVRVRTFNPKTTECSEWGYATLEVVYRPTASFGKTPTAVRQADGSALLTVDTNWLRGGNRFSMKNVQRRIPGKGTAPASAGTGVSKSNLEPDFTVSIPRSIIGDADRVYATFSVVTSDGVGAKLDADYFDIEENSGNKPDTIAPPVISIEDGEAEAIVSVTSSGGAYTSVHVAASYVDALGNETLIEAAATEADGVWTAKVEAPPYDIPMTYRVAVTNADGWDYVEVEHETPSMGRCTWSNDRATVSIHLDLEASSSFSPNVEAFPTTGGASVARFGRGGSRTLALDGTLIASSGAWRADLEALRQPAAWVYRKPGGERYKVVITSLSESEAKSATGKTISVSISMLEVE